MISVIIPVYNAEKTIEKCVESIEDNTYKNIEIILIDDCSQDNSWNLCQKFAKIYPNVKCVRNESNRGVSYTRNRGIEIASGKYTMFVDSDDWVEQNYFDEFLHALAENVCKLAICGYVNHDEKMSKTRNMVQWNDAEELEKYDIKSILEKVYEKCLLQQLWNKIFITSMIKENGIKFDESISIGEDTRFVLDYIQSNCIEEICLINKTLYHYMRGNEDSLMYKVGDKSVEVVLSNLTKLYQILGMEDEQIEIIMQAERKKQIEIYAYLIFHNKGMKRKEKKALILKMDSEQGKKLYRMNSRIYYKEKIGAVIKKGI